jgi:hypothetical protein
MTENNPTEYQPGQVANGHVWTGTEWLPIEQPKASSGSPMWRTVLAVVALIVAALAGIQGLSWLGSFLTLDGQGNPFAGLLAVLGMGALAVAAAFGIAGVWLLNKKD